MSDIADTAFTVEERQFFAIRCCCQPQKVLGFLLLPKSGGDERTIVDCQGRQHKIQIKTSCQIAPRGSQYDQTGFPADFTPAAEIVSMHERAIYSEERGEEFWRTIPGFVRIVTPEFIAALLGPTKEAREGDPDYWRALR